MLHLIIDSPGKPSIRFKSAIFKFINNLFLLSFLSLILFYCHEDFFTSLVISRAQILVISQAFHVSVRQDFLLA